MNHRQLIGLLVVLDPILGTLWVELVGVVVVVATALHRPSPQSRSEGGDDLLEVLHRCVYNIGGLFVQSAYLQVCIECGPHAIQLVDEQ